MTPRKPHTKRRAMALAGTMGMLLIVLAILLLGALVTSSSQGGLSGTGDSALASARKRTDVQTALNLADSGSRLVLQWLGEGGMVSNPLTAKTPSQLGPGFFGATPSGGYDILTVPQGGGAGNGTIKVRLYPYTSNAVQNRRLILVETVGDYSGAQQTIRMVLMESSFARYAYFSDRAPSNWWVAGNTRFNGPVHINGLDAAGTAVDPAAVVNILWKSGGADQIFGYNGPGSFTTSLSASQVHWHYNTNGNLWTPPDNSTWASVLATGQAPEFGVPPVKMPLATTKQHDAALGGTAEPTSTGVSVPASGGTATAGVFIKGDIDKLKLSAGGPDNTIQTMDIYQTDGATQLRTTVTIDPGSNTTTVLTQTNSGSSWVAGAPTSLSGIPNGAIYSSGHIHSLSGVVANNVMSGSTVTEASDFTIATASDKDVKITGGIVYANQVSDAANPDNPLSNAAQPDEASGTLGIVSRNVHLAETDDSGAPLTDFSVHATVMAFDTFGADSPSTRPPGNFKLLGGYIAKNNGTFGVSSGTGDILTGLRVTRNFDARNVTNPPPFFPNEENAFQVISYQRPGRPLE
ncbi:MAG: hypothetical protein QM758_21140 [Armatimonas sp.]